MCDDDVLVAAAVAHERILLPASDDDGSTPRRRVISVEEATFRAGPSSSSWRSWAPRGRRGGDDPGGRRGVGDPQRNKDSSQMVPNGIIAF